MGIKCVLWFRSYLSNRNQIVNVNDTVSDPSLVTCGIPQGSCLRPLLFLCYTVELWSLELACLEHQESLEHIRRSQQFPYTFNVKIHPRLEQRWLELSNSKHGPQGDFSCKNAMMARTKYYFT